MRLAPIFYARHEGEMVRLDVAPALASWDKAGSPGQTRLAAFLDHARGHVACQIEAITGPLALRLDVGLPESVPLCDAHDLDNYLLPVVRDLMKRTGRQFATVSATKQHAAESFIAVGTAVPVDPPLDVTHAFDVVTSVSYEKAGYKESVRDQVASASPLLGEGVAMHIAFVVGPRRTWPNLWKPTIDALGAILGHDVGASQWNARDGRITDLGLHCVVDPCAGNDLRIAITAAHAKRSRSTAEPPSAIRSAPLANPTGLRTGQQDPGG